MRPLRGERYIKGCRQRIIEAIEDLQTATFDEAQEVYENTLLWKPREIALLGCNDRFYLLTFLLRRKDALEPWLYERCREVEADPDGHLDLWARYHYKSTIITFAGSIQEILCDPEIKIGIFAAKQDVAKPFLSQIKEELENTDDLKRLYPDVLWENPRTEAPKWSMKDGITIKRQSNPKEATVEAYGLIDGMPTGRHFGLLIYDDLVTEKLVTNDLQIIKCTRQWELSDNLGSHDGTRKWHAGTRYSMGDTYGIIMERGILTPRVHPATANGKRPDNNGETLAVNKAGEVIKLPPVFLSRERILEVMNTQRSTFAAQMLQNPLGDNRAMFEPTWLRPYAFRPRTLNVYIMVDPSSGRKMKRSDRTAMVVIGVDSNDNKYLLDGYCHRMKLSERWQNLRNLYRSWNQGGPATGVMSLEVGYEEYGLQTDIQYIEIEQSRSKDVRDAFGIKPLNQTAEQDQSKKGRVSRLEPDFMGNKFYMPEKVYAPDVHLVDWQGEPMFNKDGSQVRGPATCVWEINPENGNTILSPIPINPKTGLMQETPAEARARREGEPYRIVKPIRRRDEDGNIYDLTRMFFEEFKAFPLAPHDDLIDAVSRIYDMEYVPPSSAYDERNYIETMMKRAS